MKCLWILVWLMWYPRKVPGWRWCGVGVGGVGVGVCGCGGDCLGSGPLFRLDLLRVSKITLHLLFHPSQV